MSKIQSIAIPRIWPLEIAERWIKSHHYKPLKKVHITANYYRYRISTPQPNKHYYAIKLPNGVILINMS
jgi:hypothetical protein